MRPKRGPTELEQRILGLAEGQHGQVSRSQLLALGLGAGAIKHRVTVGRLIVTRRGVYSVGVGSATRERRWMGALLSCGRGAVLSHLSAAALWELRPVDPATIDVSIPRRGTRPHDGIRVHRPRHLDRADVDRRYWVPVTSVPRTLIDVAEVLSCRSLERAVDEAEFLKLLSEEELASALERNRGRTGAKRLRRTLDRHRPGTSRTRTKLEEAFYVLVTASGLPQPEVNVPIGRLTVDFLWRERGLVAETDGGASHNRAAQREEDSRRDAVLAAAGYETPRFTWHQIHRPPAEVLAALSAKLDT